MSRVDLSLQADYKYNLELFGNEMNLTCNKYGFYSFDKFLQLQNENLKKPIKPPFTEGKIQIKNQVKKETWNKIFLKKLKEYETKKTHQILLKKYPQTLRGYAEFLAENEPKTAPFFQRFTSIPVSEKHRKYHTYITGGTGSGKSEVIKSFIYHYLTKNKSTAIVLLSPHDEICDQVARFKTHITDDRLVYIAPNIHPYKCPCLNPFDIPNKADLTDIEAENKSESFRLVFQELLQLENKFSEQMSMVLSFTIPVLFKMENTSIYSLFDFLEPQGEQVTRYIDFANANFQNKTMLDFLNGAFLRGDYKQTQNSILSRLQAIFGTTLMQRFLAGTRTIDLESLIQQRKCIIFNITKGTAKQEWLIMGKIVIAMLKNIAFERVEKDKDNYIPCHLFIDECQNYVTDSMKEIFEECRKNKLYLTMAQQTAGNGMKTDLFDAIMGNTGIKITGRNGDPKTLVKMSHSTGASLEELSTNLGTGRFSLWKTALPMQKQEPPIIVTMPTNTIDDKQSMTAEQWEIVKKAQIRAFYTSNGTKPPKEEKEPTERKITALNNDLNDFLN